MELEKKIIMLVQLGGIQIPNYRISKFCVLKKNILKRLFAFLRLINSKISIRICDKCIIVKDMKLINHKISILFLTLI